ncbi:MAG: TRAP transporter small permease [Lachnospiraceae bacterium]|nr:TRAP transporter small permease [Lachnospiraceae bacterium]
MKKIIKFILEYFEEILASIFIIITTGLVLVNIFFRYFLHSGIYWSEEVATSCFVWSVFLGSASAYKRGMHLGVDILVNKMPGPLRKTVKLLVNMILVVINGVIFYLSCKFVSLSYIKPTAVLGVSSAWVSSSLIVGFGLTTLYSVMHLITCIRKLSKGEEV